MKAVHFSATWTKADCNRHESELRHLFANELAIRLAIRHLNRLEVPREARDSLREVQEVTRNWATFCSGLSGL